MFLEISTIFGLPAHPLIVHAAVVLVPLAAIAFAATCWRRSWRGVLGIPIAALAVSGALAAWLATQSGDPLEHSVKEAARAAGTTARFGEHPEQGDAAFIWATIFAVGAVAFVALHLGRRKVDLPAWADKAAFAVVLVPAAIAVFTMIAAGHSGAELVWKDVGSFAAGR